MRKLLLPLAFAFYSVCLFWEGLLYKTLTGVEDAVAPMTCLVVLTMVLGVVVFVEPLWRCKD